MGGQTVLIVGAGIAGPTLAYWLDRAGFVPTIVEQSPRLREGGYVVDFWGLGYDIAEKMGLIGELHRIGYHAQELRIVDERGRRITGFGTRVFHELTEGRFVTLARSDLSRILFEQTAGRVESIFGDSIAALDERDGGVQVRLRGGAERRFDLVIGADGLHSQVRKLAFGPQAQFETRLGYAVAAFEIPGYRPRDSDVYIMYCKPGAMIGRFTLHGNKALILFVFATDGSALPQAPAEQKALLRRRYGGRGWECDPILDALDNVDDLYFDAVSQIRMEHWTERHIALVGDAAYCVSLTAGQGSALAMIGAYVLVGELAQAAGDHEAAFRNYEARLKRFIRSKQEAGARFASAMAPRTAPGLTFRNAVIRAFALPGLARWAVGRDITDKLDVPDYSWLPAR